MNDPHMNNVAAFIGLFVLAAIAAILYGQIKSLIESKRLLKEGYANLKVGGVITRKMPKPDLPSIPPWANMLMEHRVSGMVIPVCADESGFWFLGGEETEPVKLNLREWTIKND